MAEVRGVIGTDLVGSGRREYSPSDKLWLSFSDEAQIALIARELKKESVSDPKFRWFEQDIPQQYVQINNAGGYTAGDVTLTVDDATPVRVGTVLKNVSTGEQMRVTAYNSATSITVSRGWGTTAAAAIADNDILMIIGDANKEGTTRPTSITREPVEKYNFLQIFREPFELTETEAMTKLYPGASDIKTKRMVALQVIKRKIEKAFIWGEPKEDTSTAGHPIRATGGLNYFIQTNRTNAGGTLTEAEFEDFIGSVFKKGGNRKMGFVSPLISSAIAYWAKNKLQMKPLDKTYGMKIATYVSPHGELDFVTERILAENPTWNGYGFVLDLNSDGLSRVGYRYLAGEGMSHDLTLKSKRQANDEDLMAEEYYAEVGLFLANEDYHGVLYGVTSYS